ncbi:MAG: DNA polymerase/3'-5' exonuclease PolX [Bdellovibrionota bacterium]
MTVSNNDVASVFETMADLLEIEGANQFRVRAYRNAARTLDVLPEPLADMVSKGRDLTEIPGIGKDLAGKIMEIISTGKLAALEEISDRTPPGLLALLKIHGVGPKRVRAFHEKFKVKTIEDLDKIIKDGKLKELRGIGPKLERSILDEIDRKKNEPSRFGIDVAGRIADDYIKYILNFKNIKNAIIAGSCRRKQETVGDLDILVTFTRPNPAVTMVPAIMDKLVKYDGVNKILAKGGTRATVLLKNGIQVDIRVVPESSYGSALLYFTGSKAHNIAVRSIAIKKGLKVNEYGVFKRDKAIAGRTEEEVYGKIGLPYIEPELRENRGEIEAALSGRLPRLITEKDIRGDFHAHTVETDGHNTPEEMAMAAKRRGYTFLAITDHTKRLTVARGLDPKRLAAQIKKIDKFNEKSDGLILLKGSEVDILEDGSLDLPDDILKELDVRVCSVHYKFNLTEKQQTERIIRAMDNPYFNIFAHPTGKLIGSRPQYKIDIERILVAAKERGCFLELNAQPERLDLDDVHCKMAKNHGVKVVVSTDAHSEAELGFMRFGIQQARRGWLEPGDILNTLGWNEIRKLLKRK